MTAATLVETLRARGITLRTDGQRIGVRPAGVLTPEEREGLRRHRVEVLAMLAPPEPAVELDRKAVAEVLGPDPDVHAVACLQFDVLAAVREIEAGVRAGVLAPRRLVHGRPLANWLPLDIVARLLRRGR